MAGQNKKYDDYIVTKRNAAKDLGMHLSEIYPKELFKDGAWKYLDKALGFLKEL
ncbi:MAG: hypothetical protein HZA95_02020 [Candidatus Vogelbacteria bacterium]|nr:hypothetical protein [Candidatus Vogelbacteria bacterium]